MQAVPVDRNARRVPQGADLPNAAVDSIFAELSAHDLLMAASVCRSWRDISQPWCEQAKRADQLGLPTSLTGRTRAATLQRSEEAGQNLALGQCRQLAAHRSDVARAEDLAHLSGPYSLTDSVPAIHWGADGRVVAFDTYEPRSGLHKKTTWILSAQTGSEQVAFSTSLNCSTRFGDALLSKLIALDRRRPQGHSPDDPLPARIERLPLDGAPSTHATSVPLLYIRQTFGGSHFVRAGSDGHWCLDWLGDEPRPQRSLALQATPRHCAVFSPTFEHAAAIDMSVQPTTMEIFSTRSGTCLGVCTDVCSLDGLPQWDISGRVVAALGVRQDLKRFDTKDGSASSHAVPRAASCAAFTLARGGRWAGFVAVDGGVDCLAIDPGASPRHIVMAEPTGTLSQDAPDGWQWSPNGQYMAGLVETHRGHQRHVRVTTFPVQRVMLDVSLTLDVPWLLAWSPDSSRLALAPQADLRHDGDLPNLRIFDVASGNLQLTLPDFRTGEVLALRTYKEIKWSPDGSRLALRFKYGSFELVAFD